MTETTLTQMVLVEPSGKGTQISPRQIRELMRMGLAYKCTQAPLTWHTELELDQIDKVLEAASLIDCGFCGATATQQAPTKGGDTTLAGFGKVRLLRLHLCDDCALLVQTDDRDVLAARYLDHMVRLNQEVRPDEVRRVGEANTRAQLAPAVTAALRETFAQIIGAPRPLQSGAGFIVIGGDHA